METLTWLLFDATSFSFELPFSYESLGTKSVNTYNATKSAKHTASLAGNRNAGKILETLPREILPLQAMWLAKAKRKFFEKFTVQHVACFSASISGLLSQWGGKKPTRQSKQKLLLKIIHTSNCCWISLKFVYLPKLVSFSTCQNLHAIQAIRRTLWITSHTPRTPARGGSEGPPGLAGSVPPRRRLLTPGTPWEGGSSARTHRGRKLLIGWLVGWLVPNAWSWSGMK